MPHSWIWLRWCDISSCKQLNVRSSRRCLKFTYAVFLDGASHTWQDTVCQMGLFAVITTHLIHFPSMAVQKLIVKYIKTSDTPTLVSFMHVKVLRPLCVLVNVDLFIRTESTVTFPTSARGTVITSLIDICLNSHLLAYFCTDWRLDFSSPDNFIKAVMVRQSDWRTETKE